MRTTNEEETTTPRRKPGRPQTVQLTEVNTGYATPCLLWGGAQSKEGYGFIGREGFRGPAHRFFYIKENGPVPKGLELDHQCDIKLCANHAHLLPVPHRDNIRRSRVAKLNPKQVEAIRAMYATGKFTQKAIAKLYNVTQASISFAVNRKRWADI